VATRQQESASVGYSHVRLHLDDLFAIEETLRALADDPTSAEVEVSNANWKADSVQELVDQEPGKGPFAQFEITSQHGAYVRLRVAGWLGAELSVSDVSDLRVSGAYTQIDGILRRSRLPLPIRIAGSELVGSAAAAFAFIGVLGLFVAGIFQIIDDSDYAPDWVTPHTVAFVLVMAAIALFALRLVGVRSGLVYLERKEDRPSFWQRNKDQLMLSAVNTIASLLIGGAVGWFLRDVVG